jgi:hypothetical protein
MLLYLTKIARVDQSTTLRASQEVFGFILRRGIGSLANILATRNCRRLVNAAGGTACLARHARLAAGTDLRTFTPRPIRVRLAWQTKIHLAG